MSRNETAKWAYDKQHEPNDLNIDEEREKKWKTKSKRDKDTEKEKEIEWNRHAMKQKNGEEKIVRRKSTKAHKN